MKDTHLDIDVIEGCKNPNSYGVICVKCNHCGRFGDAPVKPILEEKYTDDPLIKKIIF